MASRYCMKISQEIDNSLEDLCSSSPYDLFTIELNYRYEGPPNLAGYTETYRRLFTNPRHMILFEEHGSNSLLSLFADMGASPDFVRTFIIPDILSFAWEVDRDPVNRGRKVKKLLVEIEVRAADDEIDRVIDDSFDCSVQALDRVKVGDDKDNLVRNVHVPHE